MDVSSIAGSPTTQGQSVWQSRRQQFQQNLQTLGTALQSGHLAEAQQSFQTLLQGLSGPTRAVAASAASTSTTAPEGPLAQDLKALDTALQSGNLADAQQAYQTLTKDLQSWQQTQGAHHHHHHHRSQAATSSDGSTVSGTAGTTLNASA